MRTANGIVAHDHAQLIPVLFPAYPLLVARRVDSEEIVGVSEIADRLGVSSSVVHDWQRRYEGFPTPLRRLRMGLLWHWPEVEEWAQATGRLAVDDAPHDPDAPTAAPLDP